MGSQILDFQVLEEGEGWKPGFPFVVAVVVVVVASSTNGQILLGEVIL